MTSRLNQITGCSCSRGVQVEVAAVKLAAVEVAAVELAARGSRQLLLRQLLRVEVAASPRCSSSGLSYVEANTLG